MDRALRTLVVGGTFDDNGGKPSHLIGKLFAEYPGPITIFNGGFFYDIQYSILDSVRYYDIVFWFPNVPNDYDKLRNVKELNPHCILIVSKRNLDDKYCFEELVSRALELKANLVFEFRTFASYVSDFGIRVFDPLGAVWCDTTTVLPIVMHKTVRRLNELVKFTRQSAVMKPLNIPIRVPEGFIDIIHKNAETFHQLVCPPEVVQRFLGNASFRCTHGFPSFRFHQDIVAVSRRNVQKTGITEDDFVVSYLDEHNDLIALGGNKPSVDTPIQVRLYKLLPHINFMMHSHVYISGAPFTAQAIPCGALEEVDSIMEAIERHGIDTTKSFALNLLGHGNTVFATDLSFFDTIPYIERGLPEIM